MELSQLEILQLSAEYAQAISSVWSNYATHFGYYLTLIFAFCAATYVAAGKMTRFQVILASTMFFVAAELQVLFMITFSSTAIEIINDLAAFNPEAESVPSGFSPARILYITFWQLGILAALSFMWSFRKAKTE